MAALAMQTKPNKIDGLPTRAMMRRATSEESALDQHATADTSKKDNRMHRLVSPELMEQMQLRAKLKKANTNGTNGNCDSVRQGNKKGLSDAARKVVKRVSVTQSLLSKQVSLKKLQAVNSRKASVLCIPSKPEESVPSCKDIQFNLTDQEEKELDSDSSDGDDDGDDLFEESLALAGAFLLLEEEEEEASRNELDPLSLTGSSIRPGEVKESRKEVDPLLLTRSSHTPGEVQEPRKEVDPLSLAGSISRPGEEKEFRKEVDPLLSTRSSHTPGEVQEPRKEVDLLALAGSISRPGEEKESSKEVDPLLLTRPSHTPGEVQESRKDADPLLLTRSSHRPRKGKESQKLSLDSKSEHRPREVKERQKLSLDSKSEHRKSGRRVSFSESPAARPQRRQSTRLPRRTKSSDGTESRIRRPVRNSITTPTRRKRNSLSQQTHGAGGISDTKENTNKRNSPKDETNTNDSEDADANEGATSRPPVSRTRSTGNRRGSLLRASVLQVQLAQTFKRFDEDAAGEDSEASESEHQEEDVKELDQIQEDDIEVQDQDEEIGGSNEMLESIDEKETKKKKKKGVVKKAKKALHLGKKKTDSARALQKSFVVNGTTCVLAEDQSSIPEHVNLLVEIVSGRNLLIGDTTTSDPYVVVKMGDRKIHKTSKIMKTLNPNWTPELRSTFLLACEGKTLFDIGLTLKVKDWDRVGGDDPLGKVSLDYYDLIGEEGELREFPIVPPKGQEKLDAGTLTIRCRRATRSDFESLKGKEKKNLFD